MLRGPATLCLALSVAGCSLTQPAPGSYSCAPDGSCLDGFVCNAQNRCVAPSGTTTAGASSGPGSGSGGVSTGVGGSSGGTSGSGASSGGASSAATGTSRGVSGTSSGGSSTGSAPPSFAGEWDTNFAHVSLTQTGANVTGTYHQWGYTDSDPKNAGTISGMANGSTFSGTFHDNDAADPAIPLSWSLAPGELSGSYAYSGGEPYPWCGVTSGNGTPLPTGCGWSDYFASPATYSMTLQQTADEVHGVYYANVNGAPGAVVGTIDGVVSDSRVNGRYYNTQFQVPGRLSYWMAPDGSNFSGNYFVGAYWYAWCGARTGAELPTPCLGGGGIYDGTWFTNLGTLTLTQPRPNTNPATGVWFGWGSDIEYAVAGLVGGPDGGSAAAYLYALSWSDTSPLGGANGLGSLPSDPNGVTLTGRTVNGGGLWCGVDFGPDPFVSSPDGGQIGTLFPGCGLTSNQWTLSGDPAAPMVTAQLVQTRGSVAGSSDLPFNLHTLSGTVAFSPADGGTWTTVTGVWTDLPDAGSGTFTWYPDSQDQSFRGDAADAGAWCASRDGGLPTPCLL